MKMSFLRRAGALLLSLALAVSLAVPALAAAGKDIEDLRFRSITNNTLELTLKEGESVSERLEVEFTKLDPILDKLDFEWDIETTRPLGTEVASLRDNVTISENTGKNGGKVTNTIIAENAGEAVLTVTYANDPTIFIKCNVVVYPAIGVPVTGVALDTHKIFLAVGETRTLIPTVSPANASNKNLIWKSSNEAAATVDQDGTVTAVAVGQGKATITVTTEQGDYKDTCEVTVHGGSTLSLNKNALTMSLNGTETLVGTLENYDGTRISWVSSDPTGLTVDPLSNSGQSVNLTAKKTGNFTITATPQNADEPKATCEVQVTADEVREVHIVSPASGPMSIGDSPRRLTVNVIPSTAPQTVTWSSSDRSVATVDSSGRVTAVSPGKVVITATAVGGVKDEYTVEVSGIIFTDAQTVLVGRTLNLSKELQLFGNALTATPITWTSRNASVAPITSTGLVTGRYPGTSEITVQVGDAYSATCTVTVEEDIAQAITATLNAGERLPFSTIRSTFNTRCMEKTEYGLSYITNVTVPTEQGLVCYRYVSPDSPNHGVGGSERFYYNGSQNVLADLTFIPKNGFSGTANITYTGYNTNGDPFSGKIIVTVKSGGDVTYTAAAEHPLDFRAEDFADMCLVKTGRTIRYVIFEQPSPSKGILYYNYSTTGQYSQKVTSSTKYYVSSNPSIDSLTFVPADGYSGEVRVPYTCTDSSGASYAGEVKIDVYVPDGGNLPGSGSGVEYSIASNQRITMGTEDFNYVSRDKNGSSLNYILFDSLPAAQEGVLYYDYENSTRPGERVTVSTRYYRNGSSSQLQLELVSFVPASGFTGTVTIPYTGYDVSGGRYSDKLTIYVDDGADTVTYTTSKNRAVDFAASDFNDACRRVSNEGLDYVRFRLPSSKAGTLYYDYDSSRSRNTRVTSYTNYYRSGRGNNISDITFVPASDFTGTVTFSYTGYTSGDDSYVGTVQITVSGSSSSINPSPLPTTSISYMGSSTPITLRMTDFQSVCSNATGGTLSYVQFSNLAPHAGRLYAGYISPAQPGTPAVAGTAYSTGSYPFLSQLTFVPKAEFQGSAILSFTGYDTQGRSFNSSVTISLSNAYCTTPFMDMSNNWAKSSVEFLRQAGVVNGYNNNTIYSPGNNVTRGQFALMICRAFGFSTSGGNSGFSDVPANSVYAGAVASARSLGIVQGTGNGRFQPNSPITRQSAMVMICRAMQAAGRSVPPASPGTLNSYGDGGQVAAFARDAVASLVQMGVVRGNASMRLNPGSSISRAEMAVILHRVLTL